VAALAAQLIQRVGCLDQKVESMDKQIHHYKTLNEKLTHEIAQLNRLKFAKRSEQFSPDQASLLDDLIDADIAASTPRLKHGSPLPFLPKLSLSVQRCRRSFLGP